jgi:hypothetical protein
MHMVRADLHFNSETVEKIDFGKGRIMLVRGFCNGRIRYLQTKEKLEK